MSFYRFIILIFACISICLVMGCKKEKECDPPNCGISGHFCIDGDCICPEDRIEFNGVNGSRCVLNHKGHYFGSFDCGCYGDLFITPLVNWTQVGLYEGWGTLSNSLTKVDDSNYTFFFHTDCDWNDIETQFVQFDLEVLEEGKMWVTAKWIKHLNFEVAYECSALFVD